MDKMGQINTWELDDVGLADRVKSLNFMLGVKGHLSMNIIIFYYKTLTFTKK